MKLHYVTSEKSDKFSKQWSFRISICIKDRCRNQYFTYFHWNKDATKLKCIKLVPFKKLPEVIQSHFMWHAVEIDTLAWCRFFATWASFCVFTKFLCGLKMWNCTSKTEFLSRVSGKTQYKYTAVPYYSFKFSSPRFNFKLIKNYFEKSRIY